ncbi:MAG: hypothetical protein EAX95_08725 [Candidatus Thorarchaeota archaeon]|nr:hypothetical protein [Candidatus Thorarchaeota archaeon]
MPDSMAFKWVSKENLEYVDVHNNLLGYDEVLSLFEEIEREFDVLRYCNGRNVAGRFVFQILSREFIMDLARIVNSKLHKEHVLLEVMAGDGSLTRFLKPQIKAEMIATDSRRDSHDIPYPKWIAECEALDAIDRFRPNAVLLSWEPLLSSTGLTISESGIPLIWIGDPEKCAPYSGILDRKHKKLGNRYALGRYDKFAEREFHSDIYLFNWQ